MTGNGQRLIRILGGPVVAMLAIGGLTGQARTTSTYDGATPTGREPVSANPLTGTIGSAIEAQARAVSARSGSGSGGGGSSGSGGSGGW
ncbi:hypothetical protein [Chachezhania sediminis]|uniref:hypothetical protein n=1 Tax=Chachezhania sediminis TaxID=2599291 RepID=UPI00131CD036|nr:hypothetical protein [Chachezhania sediminis]